MPKANKTAVCGGCKESFSGEFIWGNYNKRGKDGIFQQSKLAYDLVEHFKTSGGRCNGAELLGEEGEESWSVYVAIGGLTFGVNRPV